MNFDFGGTLRRAWEITWKHKILWIFGILSAIGASRASLNFRGPSFPNNFNPNNPDFLPRLQSNFPNLNQQAILGIGLGVLCLIVIIWLVFFVLHVIGRGGLIGGVQLADTTGQVSFGQSWAIGLKHFWTVLLIGLIVAIVGGIIAVASVFAAATVCLIPLACIGFLLIAALGVFTYLAQIAAVTENLSFSEAIGRALAVVQANLGAVVLLAILLLIIDGIIGFLILLPLTIVFAPLLAAGVAFANGNQQAGTAALAISGLCVVAWIPVLIILRGILETWIVSNWTLAYKQLSSNRGPAVAPAAPAPLAS
jgi:hypothetical protein